MMLKSVIYKGSKIKVGKTKNGTYWATTWGSMIVEKGRTRESAINKAKKAMRKKLSR